MTTEIELVRILQNTPEEHMFATLVDAEEHLEHFWNCFGHDYNIALNEWLRDAQDDINEDDAEYIDIERLRDIPEFNFALVKAAENLLAMLDLATTADLKSMSREQLATLVRELLRLKKQRHAIRDSGIAKRRKRSPRQSTVFLIAIGLALSSAFIEAMLNLCEALIAKPLTAQLNPRFNA